MIKNPPIIKKIVKEMGGTIEKVIPERGYFYIKIRGERIFVSRKFNISNSLASGGEITKFKDLTYFILKQNNLPTPKTVCFYKKTLTTKILKENLKSLKFPIIIKDAKGSNSKGIFTNIKNIYEAIKTIEKEIDKYCSLIAQEMVLGKEFRILVLKNKVIGALELIPPRIFGDGKNTIEKLILKKQKQTKEKTFFDNTLKILLQEQGYNLKSVPLKNSEVLIKKNSCLAEGGETKDVTGIVSKNIKNICIKATRATNRYLAGIDIICESANENDEKKINILEINGKPDLYIHYNPTYGQTRNVVKKIIEFILKLRK